MPSAVSSSPEAESAATAFARHCRDTNTKRVDIVAGITLTMIAVIGPLEYLLLESRSNEAAGWQSVWMITIALMSGIGCILYFYNPTVRSHPDLTVAGFLAMAMAVAAGGISQIGGLETLYFGIALVVPMIATLLLVPLSRRLWIASITPVTFLAVLFVLRPSALDHPYLAVPLFHSSLAVLFTVVFGHLNYVLAREHFDQRVYLAGEASRLNEAVRQRTREIAELARNMVSIEETERTRIARELHDELGQRLTAVRLDAGATAGAAREILGPDAAVAKRVTGIEAGIAMAQKTVRDVVHSLRPPELDQLELAEALELLVARYHQPGGVVIDYENEAAEVELSETQATTVYRVLQEALTNVVRHSNARTARVRLRLSGAWLELVVTDDGDGIPEEVAGGFGLRGMRERLRLVDGALRLDPVEGGGTSVQARFPRAAREVEDRPG